MKALPKDLRYLLFDLDGTLTDSAEGILRCVQYCLLYTSDAADEL
mgnify:CR=1 FL=1